MINRKKANSYYNKELFKKLRAKVKASAIIREKEEYEKGKFKLDKDGLVIKENFKIYDDYDEY